LDKASSERLTLQQRLNARTNNKQHAIIQIQIQNQKLLSN
jgi:hypothetical protein